MSIDIRIEPSDLVRDITGYERAELLEEIVRYESNSWVLSQIGNTEEILELLDVDEVMEWVDENTPNKKSIPLREDELLEDMDEEQQKNLLMRLFRRFI